MQTKLTINKNVFNDIYYPYLYDYSKRYNVYYGGRASGKSYFLSDKLILKGLQSKCRMVFLMKQTNKVEDAIWTLVLNSLRKFNITKENFPKLEINKSTHTITLPNGTWIRMMGLDDSEKAKGLFDIDTIWMEEATGFNVDDFELLDGTLRGSAKNKQIYLSFNPISKINWVYKTFHFDDGNFDEDTFVLKSTYKDNKWCDEATKKRLEKLKEKNPARYKIEAEGDFATLDKLVYPTINVEEFDYLPLIRSDSKDIVPIHGMDFGFINDYTALVSAIADIKDMKLYIYDEYFAKGMLTSDIVKLLKDKNLHKTPIICDRQEARLIEELNKEGMKCKKCNKGKGSINQGINRVNEFDIYILPKCTQLITEFQNYCYIKDENTNEYTNKPIDCWNHGLDALRYAVTSVKQKAKILTVSL